MPLAAGTRIGVYDIVAALGAGGMGEVYRARDARLQRDVAIKILPEGLASDPDRLSRFEREAKLLAALNHPHIAQIYGLEDGPTDPERGRIVQALVMELVDGESLADRIARGSIGLDEALSIARQLAAALDAAHQKGIIHRDLKPANIMIRRDGVVKVLDFGLAKLTVGDPNDPAWSLAATVTSPAQVTRVGMLLGTAAYMSPEQARGLEADKRADIWAFGVIVHEMLTGKALFASSTQADTLSAVLSREIEVRQVPVRARRMLAACLERDARERLRDIADAWRLIDDDTTVVTTPRRRTTIATGVVAILLAVIATLLWVRFTSPAPGAPPVSRYDITLLAGTALNVADRPAVAISPDGSTLAFVVLDGGTNRLVIRKRDEIEPRVVPGSEGATNPVFSPDGRAIAFFSNTSLSQYANGAVTSLAPISASNGMRGLTWVDDQTLIYAAANTAGLVQVRASGGDARSVTTVDRAKGERTHRWPHALAGGKAVLFTVGTQDAPDDYDNASIDALILATGERRPILKAASMAVYVPSGHLVFMRGGSLYAVRFDADQLTVNSAAQLVQRGVAGDPTTGAAHFSIAADGTLAYVSSAASLTDRQLAWVDKKGNVERLPLKAQVYGDPQLSPDGSRLAVAVETSTSRDIYLYTFATKAFTRFTFGGRNWTPLWSEDGKTIFYVTITDVGTRTSLLRKPADGSVEAETLAQLNGEAYLNAVTGQTAMFAFRDPKNDSVTARYDLVALDIRAGGKPKTVVPTPGSKFAGVVSPDGRFLAYQNDGDGLPQIYVRDLAGSGRWQVSTAGGEEPHWSPDGRELFYRYNDVFMGVRVDTRTAFQTSTTPVVLFKGVYNIRPVSMLSFSVSPDGSRFLMLRPGTDDAPAAQLHIALNWGEGLKDLK